MARVLFKDDKYEIKQTGTLMMPPEANGFELEAAGVTFKYVFGVEGTNGLTITRSDLEGIPYGSSHTGEGETSDIGPLDGDGKRWRLSIIFNPVGISNPSRAITYAFYKEK